ncbi:MAG TPA: serine/threonine-protein kinase [Bryobacteraceae bacterium]|nr:serine/threonine-protein kinase [Bryobacteraceae bacterium]
MLAEFQIGDTVGDYQIIGVLGRGGMGKVFQVRNRLSDRVDAMKVILPGHEDDPDVASRFLREIKLLAGLEHPNIATLRTALQAGDRILMIMEFVDGANLQDKLARGPLPLAEAVDCARQVLGALAFAHARGVIHRDVKPPNILTTAAGLVKLTDFGIARSIGGDGTLTGAGMAIGSLSYMSPEQVQGGSADARSDLYSLGVTLYEAVSGRRPFEGDNAYAVMHAQLAGEPIPPSQWNPAIPAALDGLIVKAIARAPEQRFQTAAEFASALAAFGTGELATATVVSKPPPGFDPEELARLETNLRPALGPIARHLVTKTARACSTLEQLRQRLAEQIPDASARETFLRRSQTGTTTAVPPPSPAAAGTAPQWDPAVIETLKRKLAAYLGPIAPVMVTRQMRSARTIQELYQTLAAEIPSERDRKAFLGSLP